VNWAVAASTGFGLGLAYYGGLWLSLAHQLTRKSEPFRAARAGARAPRFTVPFSFGTRLALAAVTFYALLRTGGTAAMLTGLIGVLAARGYLFRTVGRTTRGR